MKPFFLLILLSSNCFIFTTCKKDTPSATLPPATQEGKNTIGFKVNGKVWTPYSACGFGLNPCGALNMQYNLPNAPAYYFSFQATRDENSNSFSTIGIGTLNPNTISTTGNKYDSVDVIYTEYSRNPLKINEYSTSYFPKGNFTITKIDFTNQIISGTFDCTLYNGIDSVIITEGRFDCKFYTCLCNQ